MKKQLLFILILTMSSCSKLQNFRLAVRKILIGEVVKKDELKPVDTIDYSKYRVSKEEKKFSKQEVYNLFGLLSETFDENAKNRLIKKLSLHQAELLDADSQIKKGFLNLRQISESNNPIYLRGIYEIFSELSFENQKEVEFFLAQIFDSRREFFIEALSELKTDQSCTFITQPEDDELLRKRKQSLLGFPDRFFDLQLFKLCLTAIETKLAK